MQTPYISTYTVNRTGIYLTYIYSCLKYHNFILKLTENYHEDLANHISELKDHNIHHIHSKIKNVP